MPRAARSVATSTGGRLDLKLASDALPGRSGSCCRESPRPRMPASFRCLATRSAPVLGAGEDQRPRDRLRRPACRPAAAACAACGTKQTDCSISSVVDLAPARCEPAPDRARIAVGQLLDVGAASWRRRTASAAAWAAWRSSRRRSGKKPMSSMRSASSSTKISTRAQIDEALVHQVEQPAGRGDEDVDAVPQGADLRTVGRRRRRRPCAAARCAGRRRESCRRSARPVRASAKAPARGCVVRRRAADCRACGRGGAESAARRRRSCRCRSGRSPAGRGRPSTCGMACGLDGGGVRVAFGPRRAEDGLSEPQFGESHSRSSRGYPRTECDERATASQRKPLDLAVIQWPSAERIKMRLS